VRRRRVLVLALVLAACRSRGDSQAGDLAADVEFGVLFGGDVQDRTAIPLELDATRQQLGLRVTFREPVPVDTRVTWEIEKPTGKRGLDGGMLYAAELGEQRLPRGERRLESSFAFRRGDPLGGWRIRVRVAERLVFERGFEVVSARAGEPAARPSPSR